MKIFHTGDIHLGELNGPVINGENARMQDTIRCMDFLVHKAEEEQPDAIVIAGDLFHKSKLWGDQILKEINIIADWLNKLTWIAPTVVLFGTDNHDNNRAFDTLRGMSRSNCYIITQPQMLTIETESGPLQIAGVPGLDKGHFRTLCPGMDKEDENKLCSQMLGDVILGLGAQVDHSIPSVLLAHYTVVGCELENGEHVFLQNDVVIPKEALAASPFDIVCLGHIHKAQEVPGCGRPTFYCGPLNGITFNEEGQDKGFWIHDINAWESRFRTTPYRPFLTINADLREVTDINGYIRQEVAGIYPHGALLQRDATGKIVRFHYQCTEEQKKQISHKAIEEALKTAAAFYVHEIKAIQVINELQKQGMSETEGPLENLITWLLAEGFSAEEVTSIVDLARPMVDTISAKMPTGKLSGVFEPVRLEVKNYRSYREESFDFSQITFATVNGPNGVGKSAFFMDSISDCLFEETREGEITGWISNGTDIKSGSITFEFKMGDSNWRVVRTRAKSGKITLSLQENIENKWEDKGGTTRKDTQAKIVDLLVVPP